MAKAPPPPPVRVIPSLADFLEECVNWGLPAEVVLNYIDKDRESLRNSRADVIAKNLGVELPRARTWFEVDVAQLGNDVPALFRPGWISGDGEDPGRVETWGEFRRLLRRKIGGVVRAFVAGSDGHEYFTDADFDSVKDLPEFLASLDIKDIPEADVEE